MLNGEIDFILKIVSKDLQSFQEFLTSKLTPAPNVASVKTSLTIRTAKQLPGRAARTLTDGLPGHGSREAGSPTTELIGCGCEPACMGFGRR